MNNTQQLAKVLGKNLQEVRNDYDKSCDILLEKLGEMSKLNEAFKNIWLCNAYECSEKPVEKDREGGQWCEEHYYKFVNQGDNQTS